MNTLIAAAIHHSRTVLTSLLLILISGTISYITIPKEDTPDINVPFIYVSMHYEGISPADSERLLLKPMEQELKDIEGVKEMTSTAYQGGGNVTMEFDAGFDVDIALANVREKVDIAKAELPEDADEPTVNEVNLSLFPILVVNLSGELPQRTLLQAANRLQDKIEGIQTVLEAKIVGEREDLVELVVDPLALESYNLDASAIVDAISRSNIVVAAGSLDTGQGRFTIQVPGLFEGPEDILNMPVKSDGDAVVSVRDIASLRKTFKDAEDYARVNGQGAVTLEISKRTGTNIIETIDQVRAAVMEESAQWPDAIQVSFSQDQSTQIKTMLLDLQNNVASAIILVLIVVVAALGVRSGLLVGLAIPGSFLTGILLLNAFGLTVNMVVLFSLILAVGMLVDGAIVVTELADRKMSEGLHRREAYKIAGQRMAWPIIAATLTTLAAFAPLLFWPGTVGEFMRYMPITLIMTLSASLVMALIAVPTLGSLIGKPGGAADPKVMANLAASESGDLTSLSGPTGLYVRTLKKALNYPGLVVLTTVGILFASFTLYGQFGKGIEFFPEVDPDRMAVQIRAQGNMSLNEKDSLVAEVEKVILDMQREDGEFHSIYATSYADTPSGNDTPEDVIGIIQIEFTDWFNRRTANEIIEEIRTRTTNLAGIAVEARKEEGGPPVGKAIQLEISSSTPELIYPTAQRIANKLHETEGLVEIEDGLPLPGIEWRLNVDRAQAAKFNADIALIGSYVRMLTNGMKVGTYRPDDNDEEVDLVVRLPEDKRNLEHMDQIKIQTNTGLIPLSNFVKREAVPKISLINRIDAKRTVTVKADVAPGVLADNVVTDLQAWAETQEWDPRVSITFKGENEEQEAAQAFLGKAFGIALFLIAIILVTQFNSFYSAALILSAVIMSTAGVMLGLLIIQQPFSIIMSGIGVIALAGIVVNNNIVLIDTHDRMNKLFKDPAEAILRTGAQRLRPVMLTTITTILGLMPMVLSMNIDLINRNVMIGAPSTQWWTQLSTAIAAGLCFATVLTLIVTPCALMLRVKFRNFISRIGRKKKQPPSETEAAEPAE
ncbi:efflux RND transporter permease subunit [Kiloniella sp. b19]|uniref:efflux RND transporter permease subunit n=1 Tax=Kiloniella sp. GXU_MW_B19 TaxID=3141326 RepID=UPI0031DFCD72